MEYRRIQDGFINTRSQYSSSALEYPEDSDDAQLTEWVSQVLNEPMLLVHIFGENEDGTPLGKVRVIECKTVFQDNENQRKYRALEIALDIFFKDTRGERVLDDFIKARAHLQIGFEKLPDYERLDYRTPGTWEIHDSHIDLDKPWYWNVNDIYNYPINKSYFEVLSHFLLNFRAGLTYQIPAALRPYPESGKGISSLLLIGTAGSGKSTLQELLDDYGFFSLIDESNFANSHFIGSNKQTFNSPKYFLGRNEYIVQEFADYILSSIAYKLSSSSKDDFNNKFKIRANINNLENSIARAMGETIVRNGSMFQILVSSLAYYKFTAFGDYYTSNVRDIKDALKILENPSDETIKELLTFTDKIRLNNIVKLILDACGNPEAIIITKVDKYKRDEALSSIGTDEVRRRFKALKYEPWIELWYRIIEIILEKQFNNQTKIIHYNYNEDKDATILIDKLKNVNFSNKLKADGDAILGILESKPFTIFHLANFKEERLISIFEMLKENNKFDQFITLLNEQLIALELEPIDLANRYFPILDQPGKHIELLSKLITSIQKFTSEM